MSTPKGLDKKKTYRLAIRRPVTTAMLFLTLLVFGWRSYQQLPVNLMPDISYPTLTVRTEYEGAAPEDVEKLVTRPLEEMLAIVSGMVEISSKSSAGISEIILEFTWDTDMNVAQQDVRDRLDLFEAPREVTEKPVILRYDPTLDPIMRIAITPEDLGQSAEQEQRELTEIRDSVERHLKSDLEAESGIAQILVKGGQEEEIQVLVDARRLKSYGLSLDYVASNLSQQNINLSGGRLRDGKTEYIVRTVNEFASVDEIANSILNIPTGNQIRLKDVAEVYLGVKDRETIVHVNGKEAVGLEVYKEGDANTVAVCNKVRDLLAFDRKLSFIEQIQQGVNERRGKQDALAESREAMLLRARTLLDRLPRNISLTVISDQSRFIKGAIDEVKDATIYGGLLALIILFLFLREMKATIIVGIAIPISVVATFIPMFMRDITLNIMSLGGLALGVGMLVDNSIVVLESIFRCKEEGDETVDAAERGTREVGAAVTASTLTTISVFFPIAFVEGVAGQLFGDLALTVTFSLLASLLTALYFIPLVASRRSLSLQTEREVIWILRAYRTARREGFNVFVSVCMLPSFAFRYMFAAIKETAADTFGPCMETLGRAKAKPGFYTLISALAAVVSFFFLVVLYVLQLMIKFLASIITTGLFFGCMGALVVYWAVRSVMRVLLWVPLWLFNFCFDRFRDIYAVVLDHSLRFSPILLLAVLALAVHTGFLALDLGRELIPPMKQGEFGIRMEARAGMRLETTAEHARVIEELLEKHPDVDSVTVEIGQEEGSTESDRGENVAEFTVLLKDPEHNAARQDDIIAELRDQIYVAPDQEIAFTLPTLFSFKTAVELQVVGDDLKILDGLGTQVMQAIRDIPGLKDIEKSIKRGYPEVIIEFDRQLLASKGISPMDVAQRLRNEVQGNIPTRFNRAGEKVDIRVRTDKDLLNSVEDLRKMSIVEGVNPIPLASVAEIRVEEGPSEIRRIGQRRVAVITANVTGRDLGAVAREIDDAVITVPHPPDYFFMLSGQNRELQTSYTSLRYALLLAIFLVYVVMACQFESVWHPALVMFSVPLAFIGVIYVLDWFAIDLSIMVFLGGIILAGIVVNDAIVLVDYINQLRGRGHSKREAILLAGKVRLRPIIMTTVTTVLGLLPMILSSGEGSELRRPMAVTVMAGLSSATILTLLIIPMVYYLFGGRDKPGTVKKDTP